MRRSVGIYVVLIACWVGSVEAQQARREAKTAAEKAVRLYTTAVSAFRTRQWPQAEGLFAKYVKSYGTHEYVPVSYMMLAYCRRQMKDLEGHDKALREVTRRFHGSPAWYVAHAALLERARAAKDNDAYLTLIEAMLRQSRQAPWTLGGSIARQHSTYFRDEYNTRHFWPRDGGLGAGLAKPGWIMNVLAMADTSERAQRVLRTMAANFNQRRAELPPDWQYAHTVLLRRAGKADEAAKA
ncbi:hypothetical protein LCGC14_2675970, partial [marine sediment metagenome]